MDERNRRPNYGTTLTNTRKAMAAGWTGMPLKNWKRPKKRYSNSNPALHSVVGQEEAINAIARAIREGQEAD